MLDAEQTAILDTYKRVQQAMIDKDIETLDELYLDGATFRHMSGKVQTKDEFFGEITDGTLNYYGYKIDNLTITVSGKTAMLVADVTLDAKVYGSSGSWTLPVNVKFKKIADKWYLGDK